MTLRREVFQLEKMGNEVECNYISDYSRSSGACPASGRISTRFLGAPFLLLFFQFASTILLSIEGEEEPPVIVHLLCSITMVIDTSGDARSRGVIIELRRSGHLVRKRRNFSPQTCAYRSASNFISWRLRTTDDVHKYKLRESKADH